MLYACLLCAINVVVMLYQGNPFWRLVRNLLKTPDKKQVDCQHPKPILLDTGEMKQPYDWAVSCNYILGDILVQLSLHKVRVMPYNELYLDA